MQKLLFAQEVPHYQKQTEQFYKALGNKAPITDADFWSEMSRLSLVSLTMLNGENMFGNKNYGISISTQESTHKKTSWNLKSCYNFSDNCELYETIIKIWYLQFNIHVI